MSADSIIPGAGNPLAWDRYAYGLNNPSRMIDPSGHSACDVAGADPECDGLKINRRPTPARQEPVVSKPESNRNPIWDFIPTTLLLTAGGGGKAGFVGEFGFSFEYSIAMNFMSGEIATLGSIGPMMYIGTPGGIGGGGYIAGSLVHGASTLQQLEGNSLYKGATISLDAEAQGTISINDGYSVDKGDNPMRDPVTGSIIKYREWNIGGGANAIPNLVDIGLVSGRSNTTL